MKFTGTHILWDPNYCFQGDSKTKEGRQGQGSQDQGSAKAEVDAMRHAIASILHKYATKARRTGALPHRLAIPRGVA